MYVNVKFVELYGSTSRILPCGCLFLERLLHGVLVMSSWCGLIRRQKGPFSSPLSHSVPPPEKCPPTLLASNRLNLCENPIFLPSSSANIINNPNRPSIFFTLFWASLPPLHHSFQHFWLFFLFPDISFFCKAISLSLGHGAKMK